MIVGIAVDTTVDSNDASAVTGRSANVTARRCRGSNRGAGESRASQPGRPLRDGPDPRRPKEVRPGRSGGSLGGRARRAREEQRMADDQITAGNIAKELGASPAQVKKAIEALKLAPVAKKGACSYYSREQVKKIKGALK
jgi:hypothetical protein